MTPIGDSAHAGYRYPAHDRNRSYGYHFDNMSLSKRITLPIGAGLAGALALVALYFGIVSWAESPKHAVEQLWQDRWIISPILLGFGLQAALYVILKIRLFLPGSVIDPSRSWMGAGGATSSLAMAACCAHHVTDVLPVLGLTAATAFLAQYRIPFMLVGLGMNLVGIVVMLAILLKERHKAFQRLSTPSISEIV